MTKLLTEAQVAKYGRDGYLAPIDIFDADEVAELRRHFQRLLEREGGHISTRTNMRAHLLLPWINDLIRHSRILDAVEDTIGPNLLVWGAGFFAKPPGSKNYISWHQDSTYWGLSSPDITTAWVAFSPSTVESGCMRVVPGSHLHDQLPHKDTFAKDNMLSRGQEVDVDVDERQAVDIVLEPGQISLHHIRLVHGSESNRSGDWRIGLAIRYLPTYVRQISGHPDSATLVRGKDEYGHFELEPRPKAEFDADAVAYHTAMVERSVRILYKSATQVRDLGPAHRAATAG
jgi:ectoine hydroxylase-related dioxygenase (phytanoyl-CoA dioxygenase family)